MLTKSQFVALSKAASALRFISNDDSRNSTQAARQELRDIAEILSQIESEAIEQSQYILPKVMTKEQIDQIFEELEQIAFESNSMTAGYIQGCADRLAHSRGVL